MGDVFPSPGFKELMDHGLVKSSNSLQTFLWCGPNNPNIPCNLHSMTFFFWRFIFLILQYVSLILLASDPRQCYICYKRYGETTHPKISPSMSHLSIPYVDHPAQTSSSGTTRSRKGEKIEGPVLGGPGFFRINVMSAGPGCWKKTKQFSVFMVKPTQLFFSLFFFHCIKKSLLSIEIN